MLFGYPLRVGLSVAVALAQIGEFSFIVANLGSQLGVLSPRRVNVIVASAILSIALNPLLYRLVDPMTAWISRRPVDSSREEPVDEETMRHRQTLIAAGVPQARSVIISVAGLAAGEETIRLAKELNPKVQVLARTAYIREQAALQRAGADVVLSGEAEVALALAESILGPLGATAEQIDRERARVHAELATATA